MVSGADPETFNSSHHAAVTHTAAMIDVGLGDGKILQLPTATENKILKRGATAWELGDPYIAEGYIDGALLTLADSGGFNPTYPATKAVDNDDGTNAAGDTVDEERWISLELPSIMAICGARVKLFGGNSGTIYVDVLDHLGNWVEKFTYTGSATLHEPTWAPVVAMKMRARVAPTGGNFANFSEIDVKVRV